jgi:hypothetical protein
VLIGAGVLVGGIAVGNGVGWGVVRVGRPAMFGAACVPPAGVKITPKQKQLPTSKNSKDRIAILFSLIRLSS